MDERDREFINKLADLMEEYRVEMFYTTDDDGIHIEIDGADVFQGFLTGKSRIAQLRDEASA